MWHAVFTYSLRNPIGYGPDSFRNLNKHKSFMFMADYDYKAGISHKMRDGSELLELYSPSKDAAEIQARMDKVAKDGFRADQLSTWDNPHLHLLTVLFEYGIIGLLLVCGFIREIYCRFRRTNNKNKELIVVTSCLMVFFITGLTHFPFHLARIGYLFPVLLGAFYSLTDSKG